MPLSLHSIAQSGQEVQDDHAAPANPAAPLARPSGRHESADLGRERQNAEGVTSEKAVGHALSLIGSYQACNRTELIRSIRSLDARAWEWITSADAEQLRSRFLPDSSNQPGHVWDSPRHGERD